MSSVRNGLSAHLGVFHLAASVPGDLVAVAAEGPEDEGWDDGAWAAWQGISCTVVDGRSAVVLVSMTVTALRQEPGTRESGTGDAGGALAARLRARHAGTGARVRRFVTADGHPGVSTTRVVTQRLNGRDVATAQAQALVAYPEAGALGIVSAVAVDPADLSRAARLVSGIAARMSVTSTAAAALQTAAWRAPRRRRR
jgi:hypothetical protein